MSPINVFKIIFELAGVVVVLNLFWLVVFEIPLLSWERFIGIVGLILVLVLFGIIGEAREKRNLIYSQIEHMKEVVKSDKLRKGKKDRVQSDDPTYR